MPPHDGLLGGGFAATKKAALTWLDAADKAVAKELDALTHEMQSEPSKAEKQAPPTPKARRPASFMPDYLSTASWPPANLISTSSLPHYNSTAIAYSPSRVSMYAGASMSYGKIKSKCGHTIDAGDNFCRQCGKRAMKVDE